MKSIVELVTELVPAISSAYRGLGLILITAIKGVFNIFFDIIWHITIPAKIDFIRAASYGSNTS